MEEKKIKIYSKKEIEGKCPHCGSWKIGMIGKTIIEPGGPNCEVWICDECKQGFNVSLIN